MGYRRTVGGFGTALEIKRLMLLVFAIFLADDDDGEEINRLMEGFGCVFGRRDREPWARLAWAAVRMCSTIWIFLLYVK
jgi:hypothetical protein